MLTFMKNLLKFFKTLFASIFGKIDKVVGNHGERAVRLVQAIKTVVENPLLDVATALIPGKIDNDIVRYSRDYLGQISEVMNKIYEFTKDDVDKEKLIDNFVEFIRNKPYGQRIDIWTRFAAEAAKYTLESSSSGKKISLAEAYALTQIAYEAIYKQKLDIESL